MFAIASATAAVDYLFEPDPEQLLATLLPLHVSVQIARALLESSAAEHAARMQSMDSALERLVTAGTVSGRDALDKALDKETFARIPSVARQLAPEQRPDL